LMVCSKSVPWGHVAEWLRNGLQNRVLRFNSGRGLHTQPIDFTKILCSQAVPSGIHDPCPEMAASIMAYFEKSVR
jgi:hypothetical protein